MIDKIKIKVKIKNGKFSSNLPMIKDVLKSLEGQTIDVTFEKRVNNRSVQQNRYYFGCVVPIWQNIFKEEWGDIYSKEQTHEVLKGLCNYEEKVIESTGEIVKLPKSTQKNTTVEFEEFVEKCRRLALDSFGVMIPLPNESLEIDL